MISKQIRGYGKDLTIACDGRCDKAWGINGRPRLYFMESAETPRALKEDEEPRDEDDQVYIGDNELGTAPGPGETVGMSEGGHLKPSATPLTNGEHMNKWCFRECERGETFEAGETIVIRDLTKPRPNIPRKS